MSHSIIALVGYAGWTMLLLGLLVGIRTALTLGGKRQANSFKPDGADGSDFDRRLVRAHANCYENLPVFAVIVLAALASGNGAVTHGLALWVLAARVAQSCIHLVSTSPMAVTIRACMLLVQLVIQGYWVVQLLRIAM